jgi:hypothetical protein
MWLFDLLPNFLSIFLITGLIVIGLLGTLSSYFIQYIPLITPYASLVKTAGIILLVVGVYLYGGYDNDKKWQDKVTALEAKVKASEQQSRDANDRISDLLIEKTKAVKEKQIIIQEKIKEVATKIDAECRVSPDVIEILNNSARKK